MRESRRQLLRALVAVLCLLGAAWTCTAMLRPHRTPGMTWEQALQLAEAMDNPAAAIQVAEHTRRGLAAIRRHGPAGRSLLDQLATEAAR